MVRSSNDTCGGFWWSQWPQRPFKNSITIVEMLHTVEVRWHHGTHAFEVRSGVRVLLKFLLDRDKEKEDLNYDT